MAVFWDIELCGLVEVYWHLGACCLHHQGKHFFDDEGSKHPWNTGELLPDDMVQSPRWQSSSPFLYIYGGTDNLSTCKMKEMLYLRFASHMSFCSSHTYPGLQDIVPLGLHSSPFSVKTTHHISHCELVRRTRCHGNILNCIHEEKNEIDGNSKVMKWRTVMIKVCWQWWYFLSEEGSPILLEGACQYLHHMKAVQGSREGKG
jgi:hypothetical protein